MSKKYFINNLDTTFGEALLEELVKQPTEDPVHMCTLRVPRNTKPNGIKKILKRQKPKLFAKKAIEETQVFVYNLDQTDISDIDFGIEMMQRPFEESKVFILVSDIMAWSNSGRKVKQDPPPPEPAQGEEGQVAQEKQAEGEPSQSAQEDNSEQDGENSDQKDEKEELDDEVIQDEEKEIVYTFYEDSDFACRVPLQKYTYVKQIEEKVLKVKKENVKVFIVCPGIVYGCGEDTFYSLFKAAWLQEPKVLPYLDEGQNLIPTVHIKDLVKFVIKLAESPPEEGSPYLLAFDETENKTQKSIVEAISQGIGSGLVESVKQSHLIQNVERFKLNIDIKPSKFFVGTAEQPAQFQWTAKKGIKDNINSLRISFCEKESLRPMKLIVLQNQKQWTKQSRIQYILETFSTYYRVPVLTIQEIMQYARQFADGDLREAINEEWENMAEYLKSGDPFKRGLDQTMKVFYRMIRWRLQRNDCTNRGYILENFPNFRTELQYVFNKISNKKFKRKIPKKKKEKTIVAQKESEDKDKKQENDQNEDKEQNEGEEAEEKKEDEKPAEEEQAPAEQEQPEQEEEEQPQQEGEVPKTQAFYPQTLVSIKRMGTPDNEALQVIQFFTSKGIEQLVYDTTGKRQNQIFESLRSHIQRHGRPNNYLMDEKQLLNKYKQLISKENEQSLANRQKREQSQIEHLSQIQKKREQMAKEVIELVQNEGEEQIKKMPFRNYLMEFVVPTLNEGLLQVSNIIPNDPVDLLAEYLYQKSFDV